jgi:hypothetical protein
MLRPMRNHAISQAQDPRPRRETEDRDRISLGRAVAHICLLVALLVVVNIMPEGLGISLTRTEAGQWIARPALQADPSGLNLWLSLSLALWVVNLYYGRWQWATRWADLGLSVLGVLVLLPLCEGVLSGVSSVPDLIQPGPAQTLENPTTWSMLAVSVVLTIALVHTFVESIRKLVALARPERG